MAGDWRAAEGHAEQLIEDEAAVRKNPTLDFLVKDDRFLLGLTVYDQLHEDWIALARALTNPNDHAATQLIKEAIIEWR